MGLTLRDQRLRLVWLLVIPFFVFARPTPRLLVSGATVATLGLLLRGWAAGSILKDELLAVEGPYRIIRNPLYLGSFLLGLGAVVAGGSFSFLSLFLLFFTWSYARTLRAERKTLEETFGPAYEVFLSARRVRA